MRLLGSTALVLCLFCLAGCRDDSETLNANDVAQALRTHGFGVGVHSSRDSDFAALVDEAFPGTVQKGAVSVVAGRVPVLHSTPAGYTPKLLVEAVVFEHAEQASCSVPNVLGSCLRKGNVVLVVRAPREAAAHRALDDVN